MSVCIVHRDGWAVTDSRAHANHNIVPGRAKKAFVSQGSIVTVVGDAIVVQKLEFYAQNKTMEELPTALAEWMWDKPENIDGRVVIVNQDRKLLTIDSVGHISLIEDVDFFATGSSAEWVMGWLSCWSKMGNQVTVEAAEEAIVKASEYDSGIDGKVQKFYLGVG